MSERSPAQVAAAKKWGLACAEGRLRKRLGLPKGAPYRLCLCAFAGGRIETMDLSLVITRLERVAKEMEPHVYCPGLGGRKQECETPNVCAGGADCRRGHGKR